jgi:cytochrome c peroxidase
MPRDKFLSWAKGQQEARRLGGSAGLAVFKAQGCNSCHTFKPAGATAKIAPTSIS